MSSDRIFHRIHIVTVSILRFKKDSFTERRATICYSNHRVSDCKVCFFHLVHSPGGWQKDIGLFLLESDWPKRWICCCYCAWERDKSSFFGGGEWEEVKFWSLFSITHCRVKVVLDMVRVEVYFFKWSNRETGSFWEMQAGRFLRWNSLLWSNWEMSNSLKRAD